MKFFVDNWLLILVAFVSGGMLVWPLIRKGGGGAGAVGTSEAVRLINREKGVLVDVSEPAEFAAGHAGGARNVPLGQLEGSKELPANKTLPLLVMCPNGGRAARGAAVLRKAGYERAVAVTGGTAAWRDAQLPVERTLAPAEAKAEKAERAEKGEKAAKADKAADRSAKTDDKPAAAEQATEKSA